LRVGGKKLALLTVFLDMLKGALAVLLAATFAPDMLYIAGFAAFVGHVFPLWLRFKGGKGVATGLGVMLALSPIVGGAMCAIWLLTASISRYSSLAALAAFAFAPVVTWMTGDWKLCFLGVLLGLVVFWRHRGNIKRLSDGSESKIRLKT
jgi:glycerol-3-phosphate acyltransferase PlsY